MGVMQHIYLLAELYWQYRAIYKDIPQGVFTPKTVYQSENVNIPPHKEVPCKKHPKTPTEDQKYHAMALRDSTFHQKTTRRLS